MRGVIYSVVVVVPLVAGLLRSRSWLATQWSGPRGAVWCTVVGVLVGLVPGLLAGTLLGDGAAAGARHLLFAGLALPLLAGAAVLLTRKPVTVAGPQVSTPLAAAAGTPAPSPAAPLPQRAASSLVPPLNRPPVAAPAGGGVAPAPQAQEAPAKVQPQGSAGEVRSAAPARTEAPGPRAAEGEVAAGAGPATETTNGGGHASRPSPAVAALRALRAATEEEKGGAPPAAAPDGSPTTVTECILAMSISCEEYMLRNLHEMARAPLPESQRETLTRLIEETDDKLARLRAALRRHRGEELVRATWNQLPEVNLPVVKPGATVAQIREKALRQTQVMIDFYRTVASYAQRPSLKNLLVNLALDGQRHMSVIEQTG